MSTAIVVAVLAMFSVAFVFIHRAARRREAERAEEYRKAAALRGWQMEFDGVEYRYSGSTEGVPWVAHIRRRRPRGRHSHEPPPLRWETTAARFNEGALTIWPDFGRALDALGTPGVPQFVLDLVMRPIAWALGVPAADATILGKATEVVEGPAGYLCRATDAAAMRQWLDGGAAHALEAEGGWLTKQEPGHLVIAVLWRHGLQIVTAYGTHDFDLLARVARVGARMARAV